MSEDDFSHLGGKITTGLKLFEEGRHEEGGEEQDGGPEKNIGGEGAVVTTRCPDEVALEANALLWKKVTVSERIKKSCLIREKHNKS